ncbi:hypothetical protein EU805_10485 [Salipiger sp. IMCC34102]|uniref:hypothetical protein n=1 Tax=Salipiger sp. IMCC34102 TaxID=2510647 RepID=UPI00101CA0CF|nr:hypothetical protein [Salipiger sp. IMCC34102]RYH02269.1 hypothetical protein EU805_10485 [Salipiger sp. IMCC34102]
MPQRTPTRHIQEVSRLVESQLGLKGRTLDAQLSKLGPRRSLPGHLRRDLEALRTAELHLTHPKLSRQVDAAALARHARLACATLKTIDPGAERITRLLRTLAKWSALGIALFIALVWWMWATGRT